MEHLIIRLLREAQLATAEALDGVKAQLDKVLTGAWDDDEEPLELNQIVALGMIGLMKAERETGLMLEVAVREGALEAQKAAENASSAAARIERIFREEFEPKLQAITEEDVIGHSR